MRTGIARRLLYTVSLSLLAALAACGSGAPVTCDEPQRYQQSVENEKLKTPDDLNAPEPYLEMPVPEPNPRPERPEGSPCLDLPPRISTSS
ncbi:MAG: hypothetical protein OEQ16_02070 [Gammaproteobacteria bacterium]|jgi:uncharacterized lipoprotein|nr:hypothetical protein [Gammaproteobacteria bacterium]